MEVIRAKNAGFCWGVERAIGIGRELAAGGKRVYTDGPLIHNKQMIAQLEGEGVHELGDYRSKTALAIEEPEEAITLVRAHGISPERRKYLKSLGTQFKDATCPDVGIIAGKIRLYTKKGYQTLIFGTPGHPEVIGLLGYTEGNGFVIENEEDVSKLPELSETVCMVSQSTMFTGDFEDLCAVVKERFPQVVVFDTICQATRDRQNDLNALVEQGAQAIIVIGGYHSANTKKLALLAERKGLPCNHIETVKQLEDPALSRVLKSYQRVGVTAGASTPNFLIDAVCKYLEGL